MSNVRSYLVVSAAAFAFVAIAHVVRAIEAWPIEIGGWSVPVPLSWLAAIAAAVLSAWASALLRTRR